MLGVTEQRKPWDCHFGKCDLYFEIITKNFQNLNKYFFKSFDGFLNKTEKPVCDKPNCDLDLNSIFLIILKSCAVEITRVFKFLEQTRTAACNFELRCDLEHGKGQSNCIFSTLQHDAELWA